MSDINLNELNFEVSSASGNGRKSKADKEQDARAFFACPENQKITEVGKLLSQKVGNGTLADVLVTTGKSLPLGEKITVKGVDVKLAPGQTLGLESINSWACPFCNSAHGSGKGVSDAVSGKLLATNRFFVDGNGKLFTISTTCYGDYVKALSHAKHIHAPVAVAAPAKAQAKGQQKVA
jgi:hypothetical protein